MHTPALTWCISIHLAGLNCPFSKPVSSAAEIPPRPPTQTAAGGRAQSRQAILATQRVLFCTQYWYCPFCCLFSQLKSTWDNVKGAALRAAWVWPSQEPKRRDDRAFCLSLSPGEYCSMFPSPSIQEAKECAHHLDLTSFSISQIPFTKKESFLWIYLCSSFHPQTKPSFFHWCSLFLPSSLSFTASSLCPSHTQLCNPFFLVDKRVHWQTQGETWMTTTEGLWDTCCSRTSWSITLEVSDDWTS